MGNWGSRYIFNPDGTPSNEKPPSFDPMYGFPNGRKERGNFKEILWLKWDMSVSETGEIVSNYIVMIATQEEMEAAKIPLDKRDFCAHKLIDYKQCRQEVWPWAYQCAHEKHAYLTCEFEDYIIRMKEYEREKRLLRRNQRIEARAAA